MVTDRDSLGRNGKVIIPRVANSDSRMFTLAAVDDTARNSICTED